MTREKKEFTAESKLGFMRFIQVYNVFVLFVCITGMSFARGSSVQLDFPIVVNVFMLLSQAVVVWLIARRKLYTRQIIIGLEIFEYLSNCIVNYMYGNLDIVVALIDAIPATIVILYFAFSRRAKAVLVQPWSDKTIHATQEAKNRNLWDPKSKEFWMRMLIYFFIFSVMGHWMEMGLQILIKNGIFPGTIAEPDSLTWRDGLNPFIIYGIAVVMCGLVLYPFYLWLKEKLPHTWQAMAISFVVNALFCASAELIAGLAFNADLHAWDYSNQLMNFMGQVCLLYTVAFGVVSSLITWVVYPLMERQFSYVNRDVFRVIFAVSCVLFIMIYATYTIDPPAPVQDFLDKISSASQGPQSTQ